MPDPLNDRPLDRRGEPVLTAVSISAATNAAFAVLVAFGLPLSDEQVGAILGLVAVLTPILAGLVARRFVTPTRNAGMGRSR